jgi:MOSC domain-containing protein YiiM
MTEQSVCISDVIRIGTVSFDVSHPRQPRWKLARRWRMLELTGMVVRNGRSDWYPRVLEQGWIEAKIPAVLIERPNPAWSIARATEILHHRKTDLPLTLELANVPGLTDSWVEKLRERAERLRVPSVRGWLYLFSSRLNPDSAI